MRKVHRREGTRMQRPPSRNLRVTGILRKTPQPDEADLVDINPRVAPYMTQPMGVRTEVDSRLLCYFAVAPALVIVGDGGHRLPTRCS